MTTENYDQLKSARHTLLQEAISITTRDRNATYGGPESSFSRIAAFWSAYLEVTVSASDVAAMMALLKIARIAGAKNNGPHKDSWLDLAGYAACGWECEKHD